MSKIRELINEGFNEFDDLELVANYVFRKVTKGDLFGLLLEEVKHADRHRVRRIERAAFGERQVESRGTVDIAAERATWLSERFVWPGGSATWGEATVEDHAERAQYLRRIAAGSIATARRHERAIEVIRAKGVDTLNDLGDVPALEEEFAA